MLSSLRATSFRGKTALVTGASRGIGKEVTIQLAKAGAKVYALAKTRENLEVLRAEMPEIKTICVDVSNWNETKKLVERIDNVNLLVNNVGILHSVPFGEITEESLDSIYSVNFKPAINISQVVVEKLKKREKPGSIVNVSSVASFVQFPNDIVYATSKAALDKLTKAMAIDLAPFKIRVNSVNPSVVDTDMSRPYLNLPEIADMLKTSIPLKNFCCVEDIAESILFLLSDKARMITGTILAVDGGQCSK